MSWDSDTAQTRIQLCAPSPRNTNVLSDGITSALYISCCFAPFPTDAPQRSRSLDATYCRR